MTADESLLENARVLIVDDDADVRESIEIAFEAAGADVTTVDNGLEAIDLCQEDPPELVVLDMMLPGRSGLLVIEKIMGREDSPAVIMITANQGKRHEDYARSMGVSAYMIKPVPLDQLLQTAAELIAQRQAASNPDNEG